MNYYYNNSINFNGIRYRMSPIDVITNKMSMRSELEDAEETLKNTTFFDVVIDKEGFKMYSNKYKKTYSLDYKPRRHSSNSLLIRAKDDNSEHNRLSVFRVDFNNRKEVRDAYNKITHSNGIDKSVYIVQLLEKQAEKLYMKNLLK